MFVWTKTEATGAAACFDLTCLLLSVCVFCLILLFSSFSSHNAEPSDEDCSYGRSGLWSVPQVCKLDDITVDPAASPPPSSSSGADGWRRDGPRWRGGAHGRGSVPEDGTESYWPPSPCRRPFNGFIFIHQRHETNNRTITRYVPCYWSFLNDR